MSRSLAWPQPGLQPEILPPYPPHKWQVVPVAGQATGATKRSGPGPQLVLDVTVLDVTVGHSRCVTLGKSPHLSSVK